MKKFIAVALSLMLVFSMVTAASAELGFRPFGEETKGMLNTGSLIVHNGDKISLELFAKPYQLYERSGEYLHYYSDIDYDFNGKLKASTTAKWIHITNGKYGFKLKFDENKKQSSRSAKVTVKGSGFQAVLKFKQYGADEIISIKRNKNKVTIKMNYAKGVPMHRLYIYAYHYDEDDYRYDKTIINRDDFKKTSYTFEVKKGWTYSINMGPSLPNGDWAVTSSSVYKSFRVESVKGKETIQ